MEPSLHLKQGQTLLQRVLQFYPIMQEGATSTVSLTEQDWMVLMDFVEHPESAALRPERVESMEVDRTSRTITIKTDDCDVKVLMGF